MTGTDKHLLTTGATILEALERLNAPGPKLTLFVVDADGRPIGSVTDGDVRRGLIGGHTLSDPILDIMNRRPHSLVDGVEAIDQLQTLRDLGIHLLPIVDGSGRLVRIVDIDEVRSIIPVEALIMAGGRGERLRPFTDEVPKPLIEVGGRPIIEHTLELVKRHGIRNVSISVNYLKEQIIDHLGDGSRFGTNIRYVHEDMPLGTAGALALLGEPMHDTLLLMNSDLLTDAPLDRMYQRFKESGARMAVATKEHQVGLPYAVMDLEGDRIRSFREKPTLTYPCNAGIYMMQRAVTQLVPKGLAYNATDLVQDLLDKGDKLVAFPLAGYWLDIGKHDDLQRARRDHG